MRRLLLGLAAAVGIGLAAAPLIFQMFSRAPKGAQMIDEFRPYMTAEKIAQLQGYMAEIDLAEAEVRGGIRPAIAARVGGDRQFDGAYPATAEFSKKWRGIFTDMSEMLLTMDDSRDNFAAVDALPPFSLFPWFFVLPGVAIGAFGLSAVLTRRRGLRWLLVAAGLGLIAAPAVFQMFSRAPLGGDMINDFRPIMSPEKVVTIQGYFLVIGAGEGELRTEAVPLLKDGLSLTDGEYARRFPSLSQFIAHWPRISADMAPMIGAMSDNVDNFAAIDALPPFPLFPWFFVAPGLLVAGLAFFAPRQSEGEIA